MIKRKKIRGFTLIEVMAGIVIMATGLLLLLPMMVTSIRANNIARNSTEASMLIKDRMETLKNSENPTSGADTAGTVIRTWTANAVSTNLWCLDVRVDWVDREGNAHSKTMRSYKSTK